MVDLDVIKAYLGITVDDYDDALTELRDRLVAVIERKLDWYFGPPRDAVEILNGPGRTTLYLRQPPVGGVVTVYTRAWAGGDVWLILDPVEYEVLGRKLIHRSWWPYGYRNIKVEYQEGFDDPPGDIVQLLLDLMQQFVVVGAAAGDVKSERIGDYSYTIGDGASANVTGSSFWTDVWNNWKRGRL
jgi:hypothetical protein